VLIVSGRRCRINFNPHFNPHVLAADGAFLPDGRFVTLPAVLGSLLG
jgi:predicted acyltransferase